MILRLVAPVAVAAALAVSSHDPAGDGPASGPPEGRCAPALPAEHHYTLNAKARPFLVWIGRSNVGDARIAWRRGPGEARRLELLIGSDPARAPMRINRWGYLAETADGGTTEVIGVMTEAKEQSLAEARVVRDPDGRHSFKAIRSTVTAREANASVTGFVLAEDLTYRELDQLLRRLPDPQGQARSLSLPDGTIAGFMQAVHGLMADILGPYCASGRLPARTDLRGVYTYNAELYDVAVRSSKIMGRTTIHGRTFASLVETEFEVTTRRTRKTTSFRIAYGAREIDATVPVRIVYRPTWWFEAELLLRQAEG